MKTKEQIQQRIDELKEKPTKNGISSLVNLNVISALEWVLDEPREFDVDNDAHGW